MFFEGEGVPRKNVWHVAVDLFGDEEGGQIDPSKEQESPFVSIFPKKGMIFTKAEKWGSGATVKLGKGLWLL